ncbi:outer membrane lipoprotein-sorting protein [Calditrichota bacterium]
MMRFIIKITVIIMLSSLLFTGESLCQTAEDWLDRLDANLVYKTAESEMKMVIHLPNGKERVFRMSGKVQEDKYALLEFIEPKRDKGTRYLKHDDNLWIYFPRVDRTMQIQGHMLRESVQGGDLSFEDMTESSAWRDKYTAEIKAETDSTVTIRMVSHDMTVSYPYREVTIDKRTSIPLKTINSGVGEVPIKEIVTLESKKFGKRYYPVSSEIRSLLVENKWTRFDVEDIKFGMTFPKDFFSKESLEK